MRIDIEIDIPLSAIFRSGEKMVLLGKRRYDRWSRILRWLHFDDRREPEYEVTILSAELIN